MGDTLLYDDLKRYDMRFADEEDAADLAFLHEQEGCGIYAFRKTGPRISQEEIENDIEAANTKWILLESPRPEEIVVAALRLRLKSYDEAKLACIDLFGAAEHDSLKCYFLAKVENIMRSLGCTMCEYLIPQWHEDVQEWLCNCGYEDVGGDAWAPEAHIQLTKPTMLLRFQKRLDRPSVASDMTTPMQMSLQSEFEVLDIVSADTDPMIGLVSDLFSALHKESLIEKSSS